MFNVANTLHPEIMREITEYALSQRFDIKGDQQKKESILIDESWAKELQSMPFFSKVSFLLQFLILILEKRKDGIFAKVEE